MAGTDVADGDILGLYTAGNEDLTVALEHIHHIFAALLRKDEFIAVETERVKLIGARLINLITADGDIRTDRAYQIGRIRSRAFSVVCMRAKRSGVTGWGVTVTGRSGMIS